MSDPVELMLERLRPHVERLLSGEDLVSFDLNGRLEAGDDGWKLTRHGYYDPELKRKLKNRDTRARRLTAIT